MPAERKTYVEAPLDVKFASGAPEGTFSGYGAVFGNVDSQGDVIAKGAFRETLAEARKVGRLPAMLLQHGAYGMSADDMTPIGVWTAMDEDDTGLKVEGRLAIGTQRGRDAYELLKMQPPAISGLSIGYRAKEWSVGTRAAEPRRTLKKVHLLEVSLVTFPANDRARVRATKAEDITPKFCEQALRDAGLPRQLAKAIVAGGWKAAADQRDVDGEAVAEVARAIKAATDDIARFVRGK